MDLEHWQDGVVLAYISFMAISLTYIALVIYLYRGRTEEEKDQFNDTTSTHTK